MTSAHQMSSRKPPVRQSTFGFPDDSAPPRVGTTSTSSHLFSASPPSAAPACLTFNLQPATLPSTPAPLAPKWLLLPTLQNVEKLSFQARLNCLYRQSENFCTAPKFYIFYPSTVRPSLLPALRHGKLFRRSFRLFPSRPSRPLRPLRLGALQKMREAFSRRSLSVRSVSSSASVSLLFSFKNVEKLSFQARVRAISCETEKLFHPVFQHFLLPKSRRRPSQRRLARPPPRLNECLGWTVSIP